ncbi:MAG: 30S ribosomal protein S12 methylthiotransferase RimO [Actinobacteria bacterium]|nr:30S ribosomal protein S12 methylthiotransferase RimO [Actinomycetota bacterium]
MKKVALVTLGCARNEVDSEEVAGRLAADGWELVTDSAQADIAVVNTCTFVESAKKDSIDALLEADSLRKSGIKKVVAIGCMAERYGKELAASLPEADAVLGFDQYEAISARLQTILSGGHVEAHHPQDRRTLLPIAPAERQVLRNKSGVGERTLRKRLEKSPVAPLKIASGCDRRCSFCAIPYFRGAFISRPADEIYSEALWLANEGVSELFLVSENTTSYGKDLGDLQALEKLLPELAQIDGVERIRTSYLQPAEMRPSLIDAIVSTEKVAPYFDLSFQHASASTLRSMRRFGDKDKFLELIGSIRAKSPHAGIRSNFIVGFPGESEVDFQTLLDFLALARLDAIGIFGYSDEEGTEAQKLDGQLSAQEIQERVDVCAALADQMISERAAARVGEEVLILIEDADELEGRAAHQGPEVDGSTRIVKGESDVMIGEKVTVGSYIRGEVIGSDGADLLARTI